MLYLLAATVGIIIIIGVGINRFLAPPATPPAYTEARPAVSDNPAEHISHTEEILIDVPLAQYNEWSTNTPLDAILPGADGIPSVVRTEMIQGTWDQVGARRRVVLADGHFTAEEVMVNEKPGLFRYQVWNYTNFARFAVDYAVGEFRQTEEAGQTRVVWTYSYHKNSIFSDAFLPGFVNNDWAAYMRTVLQIMKRESERAYAS